jgi:alkylation response protein AidB-like acyl-CoA dehydrogenase
MAKYLAGETAVKCANYAMRILGAYGYSTEYPVARFYRDAPTYTMVEGSANICKWIIAWISWATARPTVRFGDGSDGCRQRHDRHPSPA